MAIAVPITAAEAVRIAAGSRIELYPTPAASAVVFNLA
jgi:hypothetical protein